MKKISAKEFSCNCHWRLIEYNFRRFVLNECSVKIKLPYLNYKIDSNSPLIMFTKFRIDLGVLKQASVISVLMSRETLN